MLTAGIVYACIERADPRTQDVDALKKNPAEAGL
jgi:hypothetical protein